MRACLLNCLSRVQLCATPWTAARQTPLSMEFCREECWSGLPFLAPGDLPDPGITPASLLSPAWGGGLFNTSTAPRPRLLARKGQGRVRKWLPNLAMFALENHIGWDLLRWQANTVLSGSPTQVPCFPKVHYTLGICVSPSGDVELGDLGWTLQKLHILKPWSIFSHMFFRRIFHCHITNNPHV